MYKVASRIFVVLFVFVARAPASILGGEAIAIKFAELKGGEGTDY